MHPTAILPRTTAVVVGLLLSWLSVAVIGSSAFAPLSSPHSRVPGPTTTTTPTTRILRRPPQYYYNKKLKNDNPRKASQDNLDHDDQQEEQPDALDVRGGGGGTTLPKKLPPMPTLVEFRNFALPCLALWVSGPLLSLVDTAFVGLSSRGGDSAVQLAALGPATTFFDGATYLFAFLNVATTNLYSSALARHGSDSEQAEGVVRTASRVARNCGVGLMLFLFVAARPLLKLYIGHEVDNNPYLLNAATDYVLIRALSMPTSLVLGVVQASLLGKKDSVTPMIAILYSTMINLVGDFVLVNRLHMGLQGAAIATTLAQWAATAALVRPARRTLVRDGNLGILKKQPSVVTGTTFLAFAAPVLTLILGKLAAFGFMTHSAAALPGQPLPLAAHQIILSLFFFVSPFLEVISQTAQTFLPPYFAPMNDHIAAMMQRLQGKAATMYNPMNDAQLVPWRQASQAVSTKLLQLGVGVACVIASLASLIPLRFGNFITTDAAVQTAVQPLAQYLWAGSLLAAPVAVCEGVLLARRELKFLAGVYLVSTALLPSALLYVKNIGGQVQQVWGCFAAFQLFRALCFVGRIYGGPVVARWTGGSNKANAAAAA